MSLAAGSKLGPYEIIAPIGAGGMGEVYRARDTKLDRDVAIKVLPPALAQDADRLARFDREAKVLAALNHPNIAIIHGLEETSGNARAIVMELVEGPTLADRLETGALPLSEALVIARQIADALEAAHEKGVVHRDLKPANVKVREDGTVKVLDFGLATAVQGNTREPGVGANSPTLTLGATQVGMILGTAAYMAPEQAEGKPVDRRADIWSFGVVLWEMLTGKRLFDAETVPLTLADVLRKEVDFTQVPKDTPAPVRDLLKRCLDRGVKNRLQWIGEARVAIQKYQANPTPPVVEAPPPVVMQHRRPIWWIAAAAVFALAAVGLALVHFRETPPVENALRYTIDPPQNGDVQGAALSPNGRYVVIAGAASGKRQLWLRPLDALQAQPMPTTEDATYPFWSPDSRYIGFFAQGKLKKIAASGGPAQTLCDASNGRGGTWNRDDVILFSPTNDAGGLQRVAASGGVPVDVTKEKREYRYPVFLPDGRRFLYTSRRGTAETNGIYLGSLDGKENRRILGDVSMAEFVRPASGNSGHILFVRGSTLMAQPFDAASGQTSGDVFPVAEGVSVVANDSTVISGSETGLLLYGNRSATGGNQITWFDRTGKVLSLVGVAGTVVSPAISPDEKTIAFSRNGVIWLRDVARENDVRFTTDPTGSYAPFWSPQSDRVAFNSNRGGSYNLYQKSVGGSGPDEVLIQNTNTILDQWSHDGKFMVYSEIDPKTKHDLWVLPVNPTTGKADGKPVPFRRMESNELLGQLSPDNKWMAYTSDESGKREVYVRPFPAGDGEWKISINGGDQPRWKGDGREIYFAAADGKMTAVPVRKAVPASSGVAKASFELGAPVPLFESHVIVSELTNNVFQYDVTKDGKKFLVIASAALNATASPPLTVELNWLARLKK